MVPSGIPSLSSSSAAQSGASTGDINVGGAIKEGFFNWKIAVVMLAGYFLWKKYRK